MAKSRSEPIDPSAPVLVGETSPELLILPVQATLVLPVLRYIGGNAWEQGVPARDLYQSDINDLACLWNKDPGTVVSEVLATGLYAVAGGDAPAEDTPHATA